MYRGGRRLNWEHLQNWVPGALGVAAVILLVVVAANSPTRTDSKPPELPPSQSAALATKGQTGTNPAPSRSAAPPTSSLTNNSAKAPAAPAPAPLVATGEAAKPAAMHDDAMVKAQAEPTATAPVQGSPDKQPRKSVANAASVQGDVVAGRQVFKKCQACHSLEPQKTILGPSLAGIVGRKSAADAHFNYSPALRQAALTWDPPTLDAYLAEPAKTVPGNRMPFPGLKTDQDRRDVIAFLAAPEGAPRAANAAAPSAAAAAAPQAKSGN